MVGKNDLGFLKATIKKLNPSAKIIESSFGEINPKEILNTGLFNFDEAEQSAGWIEELNKNHHTPETEEYGIGSFVYRRNKPFDPVRFWNYTQQNFPLSIIRSKGLFWIASRPDEALIWGQAGGSLRADSAGVWWASMSFEQRMQYTPFIQNQEEIESDWDVKFGDRKNEIVFIGQNMNQESIVKDLDQCLTTDTELGKEKWKEGYADNWPIQKNLSA